MQWGACAEWAPQWCGIRARCLHVPVLPATLLGPKPASRLPFSCHLCQVPLLQLSPWRWGLFDQPYESFAGLQEAHGGSLLQVASPASLLERELQVSHQAVNSLSEAPRSDCSCLCEARVRIVPSSSKGLMRSWGGSMGLFSGICEQHQPQQPHKCFILEVSRDFYLLTYAPRSQWSIGHQRPPAIALCSELLLSFRTNWSPAVSALLQCLASNCCKAGLSSSSLVGSRSGLGVWCWMLASWGCVRSSPTSSPVSAWPLVPVPLAPTVLHFGSSLAIGFCRCASDRCWRMSGSFVASSVLSTMSHIRKAGLTSHWSWRCGVWFSCWFLQMPRCFWAWRKLLLPCRFWLWRLGLCLPDGHPHFPDRRRTPPPLWALYQLWLVRWQLCSSSSAQSSFCWSWALFLLMWSPGEWSCPASGCDCVTGAPGHQRSRGRLAASRVSTVYRCSYLLLWSSWSSRWPGGRGTVKAGTPARLQSSPQNFQTAFTSKLSDSWPAWAILQLMSWKMHRMREIIFLGTP